MAQTSPSILQIKDRVVYDIRTFGAKANDGLSDTAALTAAITAANTSGSPATIDIPAGTFDFTIEDTLSFTLKHTITLRGQGNNSTILNFTRTTDGVCMLFDTTHYNRIIVENMDIYDKSAAALSVIGIRVEKRETYLGIPNTITWGGSCIMSDVHFYDFTDCAVLGIQLFNHAFERCRFKGRVDLSEALPYDARDDAGLRIWGADGTTNMQFRSFSNGGTIKQCTFTKTRIGLDLWNYLGGLDDCTFESNWVGLSHKQNPTITTIRYTTTPEKGAGMQAVLNVANCWMENGSSSAAYWALYDIDYTSKAIDLTTQALNFNFIGKLFINRPISDFPLNPQRMTNRATFGFSWERNVGSELNIATQPYDIIYARSIADPVLGNATIFHATSRSLYSEAPFNHYFNMAARFAGMTAASSPVDLYRVTVINRPGINDYFPIRIQDLSVVIGRAMDITPIASAPTPIQGRLYVASSGALMYSKDGATYINLTP